MKPKANQEQCVKFFGFSMMEILFIVFLVTILLMVMAPQIAKQRERARMADAQIEIQKLHSALELYEFNLGHLPSTREGLRALIENSRSDQQWRGPYLQEEDVPKDPWGQTYVYRKTSQQDVRYLLFSLGPDKREGTEDDVKV